MCVVFNTPCKKYFSLSVPHSMKVHCWFRIQVFWACFQLFALHTNTGWSSMCYDKNSIKKVHFISMSHYFITEWYTHSNLSQTCMIPDGWYNPRTLAICDKKVCWCWLSLLEKRVNRLLIALFNLNFSNFEENMISPKCFVGILVKLKDITGFNIIIYV